MFFIDSSVLIEGFKSKGIKEAQKLVKFLITRVDLLELGINSIVFSETVYQLINKKKRAPDITERYIFELFSICCVFAENADILSIAKEFIKTYNLKPNDALILATCKYYGIKNLISVDEDFEKACEKEGIILIDTVDKFKNAISGK